MCHLELTVSVVTRSQLETTSANFGIQQQFNFGHTKISDSMRNRGYSYKLVRGKFCKL